MNHFLLSKRACCILLRPIIDPPDDRRAPIYGYTNLNHWSMALNKLATTQLPTHIYGSRSIYLSENSDLCEKSYEISRPTALLNCCYAPYLPKRVLGAARSACLPSGVALPGRACASGALL